MARSPEWGDRIQRKCGQFGCRLVCSVLRYIVVHLPVKWMTRRLEWKITIIIKINPCDNISRWSKIESQSADMDIHAGALVCVCACGCWASENWGNILIYGRSINKQHSCCFWWFSEHTEHTLVSCRYAMAHYYYMCWHFEDKKVDWSCLVCFHLINFSYLFILCPVDAG